MEDRTLRLSLKVGNHSFDGEGPPEAVTEMFNAWKALVEASRATAGESSGNGDTTPESVSPGRRSATSPTDRQLAEVFELDEKRGLVTLKMPPSGEDRHAKALVLILYGARRLLSTDEVLVTKLKAALAASGSAPNRIDRAAQPILGELVIKRGVGKGGKYRLTTRGISEAEKAVVEAASLME